jgi:hypothetical protein
MIFTPAAMRWITWQAGGRILSAGTSPLDSGSLSRACQTQDPVRRMAAHGGRVIPRPGGCAQRPGFGRALRSGLRAALHGKTESRPSASAATKTITTPPGEPSWLRGPAAAARARTSGRFGRSLPAMRLVAASRLQNAGQGKGFTADVASRRDFPGRGRGRRCPGVAATWERKVIASPDAGRIVPSIRVRHRAVHVVASGGPARLGAAGAALPGRRVTECERAAVLLGPCRFLRACAAARGREAASTEELLAGRHVAARRAGAGSHVRRARRAAGGARSGGHQGPKAPPKTQHVDPPARSG